jgi:predicted PurR-regulated permease PerM
MQAKGAAPNVEDTLNRRVTMIFLLVLTGITLIVCYILARTFLEVIVSATVIAVVFYPLHERMRRAVPSRDVAALLSTVIVTILIVVPTVLLVFALMRELTGIYETVNARSTESGGLTPLLSDTLRRHHHWIQRYVDLSKLNFRDILIGQLREAGSLIGSRIGWVAGNVVLFVTNATITLVTLFFLFREGAQIKRRIAAVLPLSRTQVNRLFSGMGNAITASLYGGAAVMATQGILSGTAYWVLGIPAPILFGLVTAVFSLIPLIGGAMIWVPAAVFLILSGSLVKGLILIAWEVLVIGMIDSVLRPYLVSHRMDAHTLLLFFAILGGVRQFGVVGLFLGPVVLALAIALISLLRQESRHWRLILINETPEAPKTPETGSSGSSNQQPET